MSMTQAWTHTCKAVNVSVQAQAMTDSGHDGRLWLKMVLRQPDNASLTAHLHVQVQALSSMRQACRPSGLQSRGSDAMPHKHDNAYKKRQLRRQKLDVAGVLSCHQCD